jgi:ketosteroid isomerase-like protein
MFLEAHNPMKHRWLFVAVVVIFLACSILLQGAGSAAPYADNADAKIRAVLEEQREAWNRADIESFMKGYWHSADLTFSGTSGVTRGWEPVMQRYRERYRDAQAMGHLDFTDIEVHRLGQDAAFVLGRWHLKRATDELGGVFTLVFQRFPEGWKIVHDHTSLDDKKP